MNIGKSTTQVRIELNIYSAQHLVILGGYRLLIAIIRPTLRVSMAAAVWAAAMRTIVVACVFAFQFNNVLA